MCEESRNEEDGAKCDCGPEDEGDGVVGEKVLLFGRGCGGSRSAAEGLVFHDGAQR